MTIARRRVRGQAGYARIGLTKGQLLMTPDRASAARELLDFYAEAGVHALVGETPADRLASAQPEVPVVDVNATPDRPPLVRSQAAAPELAPVTAAPSVPTAPDIAVMAAREAARSAASLDDLRTMLAKFEGCALRTTAKQLVFADGNPQARVMFVGEAPGREEDLEGLPFVGRSGKLLDLMMAAIGIEEGIKRTRGKWFSFHTGTREIRAIATFHPAYLLRSPLEKRFAWRDFLAIKKALAAE